jgi:ATP-dependent DNA ligase
VVLPAGIARGRLAYKNQRHITADATEEVKLDGYRAVAIKYGDSIDLFSRHHKSFIAQYPYIVEALRDLPEGTVVEPRSS